MENKPRYTIVKIEDKCPALLEEFNCSTASKFLQCECFKDAKNYGDTKEQLIRKVAQVIFKAKLERYRQVWKCECSKMEKKGRYKDSLTLAKEIVEFLGVQ